MHGVDVFPLAPGLDQALNHGTSIGGARPKALIDRGDRKLIAKFSASSDLYSVVKAEFIAMKLAAACGLDVAPVSMVNAGGKDVLLIERFDRTRSSDDWHRKAMVSALTILGLDEMMARYASYEDIAEIIRHRFDKPKKTLRELFGRICFNVLCGNTDDHARNHAAFWDGKMLSLSPAYDISDFLLTDNEAIDIITQQIITISGEWDAICDLADLSATDKALFGGRQFLNPYCIDGLGPEHGALTDLFEGSRKHLLN